MLKHLRLEDTLLGPIEDLGRGRVNVGVGVGPED